MRGIRASGYSPGPENLQMRREIQTLKCGRLDKNVEWCRVLAPRSKGRPGVTCSSLASVASVANARPFCSNGSFR